MEVSTNAARNLRDGRYRFAGRERENVEIMRSVSGAVL
jgi:hypothetical protein